jgi:hypothetical protein
MLAQEALDPIRGTLLRRRAPLADTQPGAMDEATFSTMHEG